MLAEQEMKAKKEKQEWKERQAFEEQERQLRIDSEKREIARLKQQEMDREHQELQDLKAEREKKRQQAKGIGSKKGSIK